MLRSTENTGRARRGDCARRSTKRSGTGLPVLVYRLTTGITNASTGYSDGSAAGSGTARIQLAGYDSLHTQTAGGNPGFHADCPVKLAEASYRFGPVPTQSGWHG